MPQVQLIARHSIRPGHESEVFDLLDQFVPLARSEPGNLAFDVYRSVDDPRSYVLLERYASREAVAEHRRTPHFTDLLLARIVPLLSGRVVEEYDIPA
ncbi:antibiotic biosynthesis monooxygenase [Rugosimonospora acidiphila]|uniref:Antibiotic biosynthesis monooxygenase n=1 Tax=Rugosimonospora acidiphila TaxID=556531 RepID=A0ABP9S825_9ACTN